MKRRIDGYNGSSPGGATGGQRTDCDGSDGEASGRVRALPRCDDAYIHKIAGKRLAQRGLPLFPGIATREGPSCIQRIGTLKTNPGHLL